MKKLLLISILVFTTNLNAQRQAQFMENEILVQLKDNVKTTEGLIEINTFSLISSKLISDPMNIWLLRFDTSEKSELEIIQELYKNKNILVAQKNHRVTSRANIPDDTFYDNQWQYFQTNDKDIDAEEAWDITTGGTTMNGNVIVASVLDDGIDLNHDDFGDNLWTNEAEIPNNDIDDDNNGYIDDYLGWSIVSNSDNISGGGHGTPVAGIVGAQGNNNNGVTGVNWDVKVMIIKNNFNTNEADVIEAYSYALEARMLYNSTDGTEGAFVVSTNASWGIDFGDPADAPLWCALYDTLGENGILSCGATINANQNVDIIGDLPTACPSEYLITVTNTDITDNKVVNAGYGLETIDLGAPGQGAYTTQSGNGYGGFGGTSGATPHVTGAIALLYSAPCQEFADIIMSDPALAARLVRDFILEGVDPNPSLEGITTTGGRLNLNNPIQALMNNCGLLATNDFDTKSNIVTLHPNPSTGIIKISNQNGFQLNKVAIYSIDGRLLKEIKNIRTNSINIEELVNGAYVIKIYFEESNTFLTKIVLKK